jgi:hypothetical protein
MADVAFAPIVRMKRRDPIEARFLPLLRIPLGRPVHPDDDRHCECGCVSFEQIVETRETRSRSLQPHWAAQILREHSSHRAGC